MAGDHFFLSVDLLSLLSLSSGTSKTDVNFDFEQFSLRIVTIQNEPFITAVIPGEVFEERFGEENPILAGIVQGTVTTVDLGKDRNNRNDEKRRGKF